MEIVKFKLKDKNELLELDKECFGVNMENCITSNSVVLEMKCIINNKRSDFYGFVK